MTTAEKTANEYAQHLKDCKLAAEKAATSIANLQTQLQHANQEITTQTKSIAELSANQTRLEGVCKQHVDEMVILNKQLAGNHEI